MDDPYAVLGVKPGVPADRARGRLPLAGQALAPGPQRRRGVACGGWRRSTRPTTCCARAGRARRARAAPAPGGRGAWLATPCGGRWARSCWRRSRPGEEVRLVTPTATWSSARARAGGHRPAAAVAARRRRRPRACSALRFARIAVDPLQLRRPRRRVAMLRVEADDGRRLRVRRAAPADRRGDRPAGAGGGMRRPAWARRARHRAPVGRLPAGLDPGAAAVPDRRARLLLRGGGRAGARLERRLVADPAAVRARVGPARAAVADAGGLSVGGAGLAGVGWTRATRRPSPRWRSAGSASPRSIPRARATPTTSSRGERGRGMSMFSLGGNAGFALGPLLMTPAVLAFGLHGTLLVADPAVAGRGAAGGELRRLRTFAPATPRRGVERQRRAARGRLGPVRAARRRSIGLRSVVFFGLQAFVPVYFAHQLGRARRPATRR